MRFPPSHVASALTAVVLTGVATALGGAMIGAISAGCSVAWIRREHERRRLVLRAQAVWGEGAGDAVLLVDSHGRIQDANRRAVSVFGADPVQLGRSVRDLPSIGLQLDDLLVGRERELSTIANTADGPMPLSVAIADVDAGARVLSMRCEHALRLTQEALTHAHDRLSLFNEATTIALRHDGLTRAAEEMSKAFYSSGMFSGVGLAICDSDRSEFQLTSVAGFDLEQNAQAIAESLTRSLLWQVVAEAEPVLLHRDSDDGLEFEDPLLRAVRARVFGAFPLCVGDVVIGVLVLASEDRQTSPPAFAAQGVELARHVAALLDQKLTNEALRSSNRQIEDSRLEAEEANRAKSDFLANMSHEIRTPMTAILGYAELLSDPNRWSSDGVEFVGTIQRNGEHLLSVINDILDISKIEAGKMAMERVECSPTAIVRDVVETMQCRADGKNIGLSAEFDWPLPARISSDPTRLRQVLVNLVGNAIKFTEQGRVRVLVRRGPEPNVVVFDVVDTGIGLSATELSRIFKPFTQADTSHTRRFGGTGLGLTISQRLAAMLGGGIVANSRRGIGSTFSVHIDGGESATRDLTHGEEVAKPSPPAKQALPRVEGCRVLLAEDGPDNQRLVSFVLRKAGATVDVVDNGADAVRTALDELEQGHPYSVILMDMQMPVMDGYEATARLRESGYTGQIVALTAHAMRGELARCLDVGCDRFATKPINRTELIRIVVESAQLQHERTGS